MMRTSRSRTDHPTMRVTLILVSFFAISTLVSGCQLLRKGSAPAATPVQAVPQPLAADALIYYDNGGGIQDSLRLVIRDEEALRPLWEDATSTQPSPPQMPTVDFSREMLIVASGGRMSPADLIRIDSVGVGEEITGAGERQQVMAVVVHTVRGCQSFASDAYPVAIVRVQRVDGPVRFTERRERVEGCNGAMQDLSPTLHAPR